MSVTQRAPKRIKGHVRIVETGVPEAPRELPRKEQGVPQRASEIDLESMDMSGGQLPRGRDVQWEIQHTATTPSLPSPGDKRDAYNMVHRPWEPTYPQPDAPTFDTVWKDIDVIEKREDELMKDPTWRFVMSVSGMANTPIDHLGHYREDTRRGVPELVQHGAHDMELDDPAHASVNHAELGTLLNRVVNFTRHVSMEDESGKTKFESHIAICHHATPSLKKPKHDGIKRLWDEYVDLMKAFQLMRSIEGVTDFTAEYVEYSSAHIDSVNKTYRDMRISVTVPKWLPFTFGVDPGTLIWHSQMELTQLGKNVYVENATLRFFIGVDTRIKVQVVDASGNPAFDDLFVTDKSNKSSVCKDKNEIYKTFTTHLQGIMDTLNLLVKRNKQASSNKYLWEILERFVGAYNNIDDIKKNFKNFEDFMNARKMDIMSVCDKMFGSGTNELSYYLQRYYRTTECTYRSVDELSTQFSKSFTVFKTDGDEDPAKFTAARTAKRFIDVVDATDVSDEEVTVGDEYDFYKRDGGGSNQGIGKTMLYIPSTECERTRDDYKKQIRYFSFHNVFYYMSLENTMKPENIGLQEIQRCIEYHNNHTSDLTTIHPTPFCINLRVLFGGQEWKHNNTHLGCRPTSMYLPDEPKPDPKPDPKKYKPVYKFTIDVYNIKHILLAAYAGSFSKTTPMFGIRIDKSQRANSAVYKLAGKCKEIDPIQFKNHEVVYNKGSACEEEYGAKRKNTCVCPPCTVSTKINSVWAVLDTIFSSYGDPNFNLQWVSCTLPIGRRPCMREIPVEKHSLYEQTIKDAQKQITKAGDKNEKAKATTFRDKVDAAMRKLLSSGPAWMLGYKLVDCLSNIVPYGTAIRAAAVVGTVGYNIYNAWYQDDGKKNGNPYPEIIESTKERMVSSNYPILLSIDKARSSVGNWFDLRTAYGKYPSFSNTKRMDVYVPPILPMYKNGTGIGSEYRYNETPISPFERVVYWDYDQRELEFKDEKNEEWCEELSSQLYWYMSNSKASVALAELERVLNAEKYTLMRKRHEQLRGNFKARSRVIMEPLLIGAIDNALYAAKTANPVAFGRADIGTIVNADAEVTTLFARLVANYINQSRQQGPRSYIALGLGNTYGANLRVLNMQLMRVMKRGARLVMAPPIPRPSARDRYKSFFL